MICLPRAHFSLLPSPLTLSLPLRSAFLYFLPSPSVAFPSLLSFPDLLSSLSSRFPLWRCQWSREGLFSRGQSGLSLPPTTTTTQASAFATKEWHHPSDCFNISPFHLRLLQLQGRSDPRKDQTKPHTHDSTDERKSWTQETGTGAGPSRYKMPGFCRTWTSERDKVETYRK